jgi:HAD superfamily hydrolase (TIGR01484 family)
MQIVMKPVPPILATDLDGTLIPSSASSGMSSIATGSAPSTPAIEPLNEEMALEHLRLRSMTGELEIVFVTGRHYQSVREAIRSYHLPTPEWIICDVGSSIMRRIDQGYQIFSDYSAHLDSITQGCPPSSIASELSAIGSVRLQEPEKQTVNKLSFYCDAVLMDQAVDEIRQFLTTSRFPHSVVSSLDPFSGEGLLDVMPAGVDKAFALHWWSTWLGIDKNQIIFAGDSGNDYAALTSSFRGILVGNAEPQLAKRVTEHHRRYGSIDRIYLASGRFTAGVVEGCRHYRIIE